MRRALDWLVVDEGGHAAGVVPLAGAKMTQTAGRRMPAVCVKVLDVLRGRPAVGAQEKVGGVESMCADSSAG